MANKYTAEVKDVNEENELKVAISHGYQLQIEEEDFNMVDNPESPSEYLSKHFPKWIATTYFGVLYAEPKQLAMQEASRKAEEAVDSVILPKISLTVTEDK